LTAVSIDLAVVIPVLGEPGEHSELAALLARLAASARAPREVIVVAARRDATLRELCEQRGARWLEARANRGAQLAFGASEARAATLWFLHVDAMPHRAATEAIAAALAAGAESGCFAFRFAGPRTWKKRLLAALINARVHHGGIAYGDQGLFARREAYRACGGFAPQPLFEEVALVKRLRARGTFRVLGPEIDVSPLRWERDGWWRRSFLNRWLALCYTCGISAERLAAHYWPRRPDIEA
jgi:rSAM/selenodomain-associated transferase 2